MQTCSTASQVQGQMLDPPHDRGRHDTDAAFSQQLTYIAVAKLVRDVPVDGLCWMTRRLKWRPLKRFSESEGKWFMRLIIRTRYRLHQNRYMPTAFRSTSRLLECDEVGKNPLTSYVNTLTASASIGSEKKYPWPHSQFKVLSCAICTCVSTPSAITLTPRFRASIMIVRTITALS